MQLIIILLVTVSILTFLSGAIVFFGSTKGNRIRSGWYFAAAIFATVWMVAISAFLIADASRADVVSWHINWIFASALLLDATFLGYVAWQAKYGKVLTIAFVVFAAVISALIFTAPNLLYSNVNFAPTGNTIDIVIGPLYVTYIAFFALILPVIVTNLLLQYSKTKSERKRGGDIVTMVSFGISSVLTVIFDVVMPLLGRWDMVWVGPLALAITIIAVYYTILRYRSLDLNSIWLKIFSYIVITASLSIIYMIIFSLVFAGMFRGATPSTEVIILNFIMIFIVIILMPAISNITMHIRSLVSGKSDSKNDKKED